VPAPIALEEAQTPQLHIALQDGFDQDTVVVRVNGQEVFNTPGVTTRLQLGVARAFVVDAPEGLIDLQIVLPLKNVSESLRLQVSHPLHVGFSVSRDGRLTHRLSSEPFGYL
jgi:hypothetical protein